MSNPVTLRGSDDPVPAGSTFVYGGTFKDESGNAIAASDLVSLTLTLVDTVSGAIVNSVNAVDVLNTGRGTVSAGGVFAITLGQHPNEADTALLDSTDSQEDRSIVLEWTYSSPAKTGRHEKQFTVEALSNG